jgi:RNA polymerase sigma-70 factor (TIGR02943 family)
MSSLNAEKWVSDYSDMLFRFAALRVNDKETARDLVQETFLAAWRNYEKFKGEISEKNWLFTILKNKIIDHYRKASTRLTQQMPEGNDNDNFFDDTQHFAASQIPNAWGIDYNQTIERKEFYEVLAKCKQKLKDLQGVAFTMKYLDGIESEEICKALDITPSNYWVLIHRAKIQLRSCLEKNWFLK